MSGPREGLSFGSFEVLTRPDGTPIILGGGSFGRTFRAKHRVLLTEVALKVIHDRFVFDEGVRTRFLNEAQEQAKLLHPNIARITDCGEVDGSFFYAVELCEGGDLQSMVARHGPLPLSCVLPLLKQAASGLAFAHERHLVHRDIKPSNILLVPQGDGMPQVKIIDFGLVKRLQEEEGAVPKAMMTQTGQVIGTPLFASPEQLKEEEVTASTDVFSLGMTAWFLLLGSPPIPGSQGVVVAERLGQTEYEDRLPTDLPADVRSLLVGMLRKSSSDRIQDCRVVEQQLTACIEANNIVWTAPSGSRRQDPGRAPLTGKGTATVAPNAKPKLAELYDTQLTGASALGNRYTALNRKTNRSVELTVVKAVKPAMLNWLSKCVKRLRSVDHPNVLRYHNFIECVEGWVIERELVEPVSLFDLVRQNGAIQIAKAAHLLEQTAIGIDLIVEADVGGALTEPNEVLLQVLAGGPADMMAALEKQSLIPVLQPKVLPDESDDEDGARPGSQPTDTVMVGSGGEGDGAKSYGSAFAGLVYWVLGGKKPRAAAWVSPAAYLNISGLSEAGNNFLKQTLAGQDQSDNCLQWWRQMLLVEGISTGTTTIVRPPRPIEPDAKPLIEPDPLPPVEPNPLPPVEPEPLPQVEPSDTSIIVNVAELCSDLENYKARQQVWANDVGRWQNECSELETRADALANNSKSSPSEISECITAIDGAFDRRKDLESTRISLASELTDLDQRADRNRFGGVPEAIQGVPELYHQTAEILAKAAGGIDARRSSLSSILKQREAQVQKIWSSWETVSSRLQAQAAAIKERSTKLRKRVDLARSQSNEEEANACFRETIGLEKEVDRLGSDLSKQLGSVTSVRSQLEAVGGDDKSLEVVASERQLVALQVDVSQLESDLKDFGSGIKEALAAAELIKKQAQAQAEDIRKLESDLAQARDAVSSTQRMVDDAGAGTNALEKKARVAVKAGNGPRIEQSLQQLDTWSQATATASQKLNEVVAVLVNVKQRSFELKLDGAAKAKISAGAAEIQKLAEKVLAQVANIQQKQQDVRATLTVVPATGPTAPPKVQKTKAWIWQTLVGVAVVGVLVWVVVRQEDKPVTPVDPIIVTAKESVTTWTTTTDLWLQKVNDLVKDVSGLQKDEAGVTDGSKRRAEADDWARRNEKFKKELDRVQGKLQEQLEDAVVASKLKTLGATSPEAAQVMTKMSSVTASLKTLKGTEQTLEDIRKRIEGSKLFWPSIVKLAKTESSPNVDNGSGFNLYLVMGGKEVYLSKGTVDSDYWVFELPAKGFEKEQVEYYLTGLGMTSTPPKKMGILRKNTEKEVVLPSAPMCERSTGTLTIKQAALNPHSVYDQIELKQKKSEAIIRHAQDSVWVDGQKVSLNPKSTGGSMLYSVKSDGNDLKISGIPTGDYVIQFDRAPESSREVGSSELYQSLASGVIMPPSEKLEVSPFPLQPKALAIGSTAYELGLPPDLPILLKWTDSAPKPDLSAIFLSSSNAKKSGNAITDLDVHNYGRWPTVAYLGWDSNHHFCMDLYSENYFSTSLALVDFYNLLFLRSWDIQSSSSEKKDQEAKLPEIKQMVLHGDEKVRTLEADRDYRIKAAGLAVKMVNDSTLEGNLYTMQSWTQASAKALGRSLMGGEGLEKLKQMSSGIPGQTIVPGTEQNIFVRKVLRALKIGPAEDPGKLRWIFEQMAVEKNASTGLVSGSAKAKVKLSSADGVTWIYSYVTDASNPDELKFKAPTSVSKTPVR